MITYLKYEVIVEWSCEACILFVKQSSESRTLRWDTRFARRIGWDLHVHLFLNKLLRFKGPITGFWNFNSSSCTRRNTCLLDQNTIFFLYKKTIFFLYKKKVFFFTRRGFVLVQEEKLLLFKKKVFFSCTRRTASSCTRGRPSSCTRRYSQLHEVTVRFR